MARDDKLASLIAEEKTLEHDPAWFGIRVHDRPFRDVIFAILFFVNLVAVLAVSFFSFSTGKLTNSNLECLPTQNDYFGRAISFLEDKSSLLGVAAGVSFGFGIVWLFLLRAFTKIGIYVTIGVAIGIVVGGGVYLIQFSNTDIKIAGYVLFGVAFLMCVVVIYLRKKIALTAACMAEACKALQHNPSSILVAFATLAIAACFFAIWIASLVRLNCMPTSSVGGDPHRLRYLFIFLMFGGCWIILFLIAALRTSIAGGVAVWYFSRTQYIPDGLPMFPTLTALGWAFSTSFGSMAFGSLLLAIIATIRFILYRAEKAAGPNKIARVILSCMQCCCACIYSLVQALNEFAYVYVAMYGTGFVESAQKVFALIGRNPLSTVMVETLTGLVLLFGRFLGTMVSILIVMAILGEQITVQNAASWVVVLSGIVAFIVLTIFSNVISCAVDTVFVCYCEDLERNRESGRYLMDPDLHQTLQQAGAEKNNAK